MTQIFLTLQQVCEYVILLKKKKSIISIVLLL